MELRDVLRRQDGLIRRDQAIARGLSSSAIARRVEAGDWERVHARVYRALDHPWTARTRLRAAGLWVGDTGTLVGEAAASWWHLTDEAPTTIGVAVPPGRGHACPEGIAVSRRTIAPEDRVCVDGLWVAQRPLAVLEAAAGTELVPGARLMDRALQRGSVSVDALESALERTPGRHGTVRARTLIDLAAGGARSEAERRTGRELRRAGLRAWVANHPVHLPGWGPVVLDIAFVAERLAVEIDGWAYHRDVDRFRRDGLRQNEIVIGGWRVLRVTWYDLRDGPAHFVESVRRALALSAA